MKNNAIKYQDVIDGSRSYKQILGIQKDTKEFLPYHTKRFIDFVKEEYPEKLNSSNLDMSTLLMILRYRNCDISIPYYKSTTVTRVNKNEIVTDSERKGKILSLVSNKDTFKFSVLIADESYSEKKFDGTMTNFVPKNYSITGVDGNFHENWSEFKFDINNKEKDYFSDILDNSTIHCKKFVNPQLAQAFYSEYYRILKTLDDRLDAERKYITNIKQTYIPKCKTLPNSEFTNADTSKKVVDESAKQFESVKTLCFETKISNLPEHYNFNYIVVNNRTPEQIVSECEDLLDGLLGVKGEIRFLYRLIECAFSKVNPYKEDMKPSDFQKYNRCDCKWNEQTVRLPKGRIDWFELMFKDYSILVRYYYKSIQQRINKE